MHERTGQQNRTVVLRVVLVKGMPGIFPVAGFFLPPHWLEIWATIPAWEDYFSHHWSRRQKIRY